MRIWIGIGIAALLFCTAPHSYAGDSGYDKTNDPWAEPKTKVAVHLLGGYAGYPGISDGGPLLGLAGTMKDVSFSDLQASGDWEGGLREDFVFGNRLLNNVLIYLGHGIADENHLSAGILTGVSFLNTKPNTGFFSDYDLGFVIGVQTSYEIPLSARFYITPILSASYSTLPSTPFIYSGVIGVSYIFPYRYPHH